MTKNNNLSLFVWGNFVSLLGSSMQCTALPLFILDLTGKGSIMSLLTLSHMVPMLLTTPFAGVIGDRVNRKHIMVSMDIIRGLLILPLAILGLQKNLTLPLIFLLMSLCAVLDSLFSAATSAMLPELVAEDRLRQANSYHSLFTSMADLLGPVLGALSYSIWGIGAIFVFNSLCYLISGFFEIFIQYSPQSQREKTSVKEFIASARAGLDFIIQNPHLKTFASFCLLLNFLLAPIFSVVLPFSAKTELHLTALAYGLLGSCLTAGFIIGALATSTILVKDPSGTLIKRGVLAICTLTLLFSILISPPLRLLFAPEKHIGTIILLGLLTFLGIALSITNIPIRTDMQKLAPNHIRSRIFSSIELLTQVAIPLSIAGGGLALDYLPSHLISACFASFLFLAGISFVKTIGIQGLFIPSKKAT